MIIKQVQTKDYLTRSNLPESDYVINPYIGCPHSCIYCYASFMKRFTNHKEKWGDFLDVKYCKKKIDLNKIKNKRLFISSVTDCYNPLEEKYKITKNILEQLINSNSFITISTKSKLILRDIDLLKKIKNLTVAISINTLDENFKDEMDKASSIKERIDILQKLHKENIHTVLFMSPIFPYITDYKKIIEKTKNYVDEYWFENLNLRGEYKYIILNYIKNNYNCYYSSYNEIYLKNDKSYWRKLSYEIDEFCKANNIKYKNYFYHEKLVKNK